MSNFFRKVDFGNGVKYWYLGDRKFEISYQECGYEGGCLSCSYDLLPNETPEECIRRMEKERSF